MKVLKPYPTKIVHTKNKKSLYFNSTPLNDEEIPLKILGLANKIKKEAKNIIIKNLNYNWQHLYCQHNIKEKNYYIAYDIKDCYPNIARKYLPENLINELLKINNKQHRLMCLGAISCTKEIEHVDPLTGKVLKKETKPAINKEFFNLLVCHLNDINKLLFEFLIDNNINNFFSYADCIYINVKFYKKFKIILPPFVDIINKDLFKFDKNFINYKIDNVYLLKNIKKSKLYLTFDRKNKNILLNLYYLKKNKLKHKTLFVNA